MKVVIVTVKQKILTLLTRVEEKTFITPKNEDVHFSYTEICDLFTSPDLDPLIVRLEEDRVLIQKPKDPNIKILGHYYFKLGPNFHTYKSKLEAELNGSATSTAPQSKPEQLQGIQSQTSQSEKIKPAY